MHLPCEFFPQNYIDIPAALFRKRWDKSHLGDLTVNEDSFVEWIQVDSTCLINFWVIVWNGMYANLSVFRSGSVSITSASRLVAALVMLGGGVGYRL